MAYDPAIHHRRSIRLQNFDYSTPGSYFVTICARDRACLFGKIVDGRMCPNPAGSMVTRIWNEIPNRYPGIEIDAFVLMPNHVHGILTLCAAPTSVGRHSASLGPPLPRIIQWFKGRTTNEYIRSVKNLGWPEFDRHVWHRDYYERVIRKERELVSVREYIENNPLNWHLDRDNPERLATIGTGGPKRSAASALGRGWGRVRAG